MAGVRHRQSHCWPNPSTENTTKPFHGSPPTAFSRLAPVNGPQLSCAMDTASHRRAIIAGDDRD